MKYDLVKITPTWYLDSNDDKNWELFKSPRDRRTFEPWACKRTLWSVAKTLDEDGTYRGSVLIRGYQIIRKESRSLYDGGKFSA